MYCAHARLLQPNLIYFLRLYHPNRLVTRILQQYRCRGCTGSAMRVEIRQRPAAGVSPAGAPPPKRSASAAVPGLVEAYSESCFESSTSFYIASPEHPKLGKWAQPSTLKYSEPPQQQSDHIATQCLDEAMLFASNHGRSSQRSSGRPRTTGGECVARPVWRGGRQPSAQGGSISAAAAAAAQSFSGAKPSRASGNPRKRVVEPGRAKRPISAVGALLAGSTTPSSSIRGQREAPRINTPISGRVRVKAQLGFAMGVAM